MEKMALKVIWNVRNQARQRSRETGDPNPQAVAVELLRW